MIKLPPPFANTPGLAREEISRYDERGPAWAWYTLTLGEHVGTHVDAPIHWVTGRDGADVGSIPARDARRPRVRDRQDGRDRGRPRLPADRRRPRGAWRPTTARSPTGPGCCCGPAGSRAPRRGAFLNVGEQRAGDARTGRRGLALARHRARDRRLRGGDGRDRRRRGRAASTRRSRCTTSCSAPAGSASRSSPNLDRLPVTGALLVVSPLRLVGGTGSPSRVFAFVPR